VSRTPFVTVDKATKAHVDVTMSGTSRRFGHDPNDAHLRGLRQPRPATAFTGNVRDPALSVPLGPGQDQSFQQVVIAVEPAMSQAEIEGLLGVNFRTARDYDQRLQIARANALRLYNGEPMGDEEAGRSQLILTEVKDTINSAMPTMMRVFAGPDKPVEFLPQNDGDLAEAQQAQDYVEHVCFTENDGWRALHDSTLDAFQLKVGWIHWWWDYQSEVKTEHYYGLLQQQAQTLLQEPGVTALKVIRRPATPTERAGILASPEASVVPMQPGMPILVYDAQITRKSPRNRPRVCAVPSEQILIDPDATGPHDPNLKLIGRLRTVTVSELVALGFPLETILAHVTTNRQQLNRVTRRRDRLAAIIARPQPPDRSLWRVTYFECWMRMDYDGDGIAELHHIHAIGDYAFTILAHEPASHVPLARLCPFLVAHRAIGESFADRVGDLQRAMTRVFRSILDSMSESIHPRTVIEDGMVPIDDVLNTEMGAVIRERKPGAVRELTKPFIGPQALPIMESLGVIKESRTGITRTSQGLTADVLQSTTPIAVSAQLAASADRLELVVRCLAEGIRDLYEGVLRLLCEHQDRPRTVLLRGTWTPIDPRAWMASFHVRVKDGVGNGTQQQRIQILGAIATQQKEILTTMGPNNPLCTLGQLRNTLADMAQAAGILNVGRYFNPLPANFQYQPPPAPPSPDEIVARAEAAKVTSDAQTEAERANTDRWKALLDDELKRDQATIDAVLEAAELRGKYGLMLPIAAIGNMMRRDPTSAAALALATPAMAMGGNVATPGQPPPQAGAGGPPPPAGGAAPGAPAIGLAQRLFLPPNLISALASANRPAAPPMPAAPPPALSPTRPTMPGFP
jgi:hypothetical protein